MRTPKHGVRRTLLAAAVPVGMVVSGALVWQSSYAAFSSSTANPNNQFTAGSVTLTDTDSDGALFTVTADQLPPSTSFTYKCIQLVYSGTLDANAVKMYVKPAQYTHANGPGGASDHSKDLGSSLDFTVDMGPDDAATNNLNGANAACTGWDGTADTDLWGDELTAGVKKLYDHTTAASGFASAYTAFAGTSGLTTTWTPTRTGTGGTKYKWFRIGYRLPDVDAHSAGVPDQTTVDNAQGDDVTFTLTWEARNA